MMSTAIPARLQFQCGHAALVTLPRVKGETTAQRNERVAHEKSAALARQCDFCAPGLEVAIATNGAHAVAEQLLAAEPVTAIEPTPVVEVLEIVESGVAAEVVPVETIIVAVEPEVEEEPLEVIEVIDVV